MAFKNKYFEPQTYYYKVIFICVLMTIDIIMSSFTQFLDYGSIKIIEKYGIIGYEKDSEDFAYALIAIQFLVQLFLIFALISIFSQTFYFKYGLLQFICSRFKYTFIIIFIYPFVFLSERIVRRAYLATTDIDNNELTVWSAPYYIVLYVLKYLFAFCFYLVTIDSSYELGKSKYYRVDPTFSLRMM